MADSQELMAIVERFAHESGIDADLAIAVASVESSWNPNAVRFEPKWKYFHSDSASFAKNLGITLETEQALQAISWGLLQVMGAVARELGYAGPIQLLSSPELGAEYGCKKLAKCLERYPHEPDAIAAYNGGTPRSVDGQYVNQSYVDRVQKRLDEIRNYNKS